MSDTIDYLRSLPDPDPALIEALEAAEDDHATMKADWEWGLMRTCDAEDAIKNAADDDSEDEDG